MAQQPPVGQGLLIQEDSLSHSDIPQSVGLLWTSDQLVAETFAWQHKTRRHTSMFPVEFEPTVSAGERPQIYASDRVATGTGNNDEQYEEK